MVTEVDSAGLALGAGAWCAAAMGLLVFSRSTGWLAAGVFAVFFGCLVGAGVLVGAYFVHERVREGYLRRHSPNVIQPRDEGMGLDQDWVRGTWERRADHVATTVTGGGVLVVLGWLGALAAGPVGVLVVLAPPATALITRRGGTRTPPT